MTGARGDRAATHVDMEQRRDQEPVTTRPAGTILNALETPLIQSNAKIIHSVRFNGSLFISNNILEFYKFKKL